MPRIVNAPRNAPTWVAALLTALLLGACGGGDSSGAGPATPPAGGSPPGPAPDPGPSQQDLEVASLLVSRATFGGDLALIEAVAEQGTDAWLDAQFSEPPSLHLPIVERYIDELGAAPGADPEPGLYRRFALFERYMTAPDQLRQRVASALSQIFVVSDRVDELGADPRALSSFHDLLLEHAFGNYRDLLRAVTLHPAMGFYLSHVNNARSDPVANTFPDENYAREVMQLFSIGLFELAPDGTRRTSADGEPIPTYDNDDIREFSKIFTGLSFGPEEPGGPSFFGKRDPVLHVPMVMFDDFHEPGEKRLLNGTVVPAGGTGTEDIEAAIDNLSSHPNVGPFIGRRLIQRLVTSNPSPAYVQRVAEAFAGGDGAPRGNLERTVRAVLTDREAQATGPAAGRLREPFVRYLQLHRALDASTPDGRWPVIGGAVQFLTGQYPLSAPSVFNFYLPDYTPAGAVADAGRVAPEFQIVTDLTLVGWPNLVAAALFAGAGADVPDGFPEVSVDPVAFEAIADDSQALIDRIDLIFTHGAMSAPTREAIAAALVPLAGDPALRARVALYLALISPDYMVDP